MNGELTKSYAERITRVCDYISEHLSDDLTVEKLSEIAHFSKFHFHRQFAVFTGVNVAKFILMMRLKRASYKLVFHPEYRIIDIAMDANFGSPESFSRAFKKMFDQTPSQFRQKPQWETWYKKYLFPAIERKLKVDIKIIKFMGTKVAVLEHRASPGLVNDSVSTFIEWRKESKLSPLSSSDTFGLAYDDPKTTDPDKFRFDICGSISTDVPSNSYGIITKQIPAGRCALLRHLGAHEAMSEKVQYMYGTWLPASGEELRDFPCYFKYVNFFPEVSENKLITDIYLPLR